MADLVEQGYQLVSVVKAVEGIAAAQDFSTTFYLAKGTEVVKCGDGYKPRTASGYVTACARLVKPYEVGRPPPG